MATGRVNDFFSSDVGALTGVVQVEYLVDGVLRSAGIGGPYFRLDSIVDGVLRSEFIAGPNFTSGFTSADVVNGCHNVQARALGAGRAVLGVSNTVTITVQN